MQQTQEVSESKQNEEKTRENWSSKWEFLLSCVGLSVGIGNVWRFPYLAYKNGGGAFLIPYLIMLFLVGKPMYLMELVFGQFASTGTLSIWNCVPISKGIGAAMLGACVVVAVYYNVIMSYTLYFIGVTFQKQLPWSRCDPKWANGTNCFVSDEDLASNFTNGTRVKASELFWRREVLGITDGIENLGGIKWDLALCLFIAWVIVILCVIKGVKSSGKVVYFAATFPYIVLVSLLIAALTQTGAWTGIKYFITPDWKALLKIEVWRDAASQMFFSLALSGGSLIMYGSYNNFRHNVYKDAMIVSVLDTLTSIIAGLVIFSVLGTMSYETGLPMDKVAQEGPGLAFVAYPEALLRLPWPHVWSFLFFVMLFLLGLDSEFALVENFITSVSDEFPILKKNRIFVTISFGIFGFLVGLPCVTRGGQYVINLMDYYGGGMTYLFIAVFEIITLSWIYGCKNLLIDIHFMLNKKLSWYWKVTWKFTAPLMLIFISIYSIFKHTSLQYGNYDYPTWADAIGWLILCAIIFQVPLFALIALFKQEKGDTLYEKLKNVSKPNDKWGPRDEQIKDSWRTFKLNYKFSQNQRELQSYA